MAAEGTAEVRTFAYTHDPNTGAVTSKTDIDNNVSTVYEYDGLNRPTLVREAAGTGVERRTRTEYEDANRRVIVRRDLNTAGDGGLVSVTGYDQLGRVRLTRQLESASQSAGSDSDGIKVQTRYLSRAGFRYELRSNPYRASTSGGASNEGTMGWTLSTYDQNERLRSEETFAGAGLPAPWGSNGASTGVITTSYAADVTTVIDQALRQRDTARDALGRLVQVTENPGGLNYTASYAYDGLGNLTKVTQLNQTRRFDYDSLARLSSATNPESGRIGYTYDDNGNMHTRTDAANVITTYEYL